MPEGPQMVFFKEQFDQFLGQQVVKAEGDASNIPFKNLKGKRLDEIKTFGKELLFCFPDFTLRIHLMLFGKFAINDTLNRKLRLGLEFETGDINFYASDCKLIYEPLDEHYDWNTDVMNPLFDKVKALEKLTAKPDQLICDALLDQHILAGVGNKIKNEVLFRKRVHPQNTVGQIPEKKLKELIDECVTLSFKYLSWIHEGENNEHWEVYKKKECIRDHIPVLKEKIGKNNRTCYFCDKCQLLFDTEFAT